MDQNQLYPRFPVIEDGLSTPTVLIEGREYLTYTSNNYLGMARNPVVIEAVMQAVREHGAGPGHSRALGGTPRPIASLEAALARWTGYEACITFPTGYMANVGLPAALFRPLFLNAPVDPVVLVDQFCHGSLLDGCLLCGAKVVPFRHNDLDDLRRKLKRYGKACRMIAVEGIYCLHGTIIDVGEYVEIAKEHGCILVVDDAHGIGILGERGGGVTMIHPDAPKPDLYMGAMDKALGSTGGFLCGNSELIRYLSVGCRSQILSSCLPIAQAAAALAAVDEIQCHPDIISSVVASAKALAGSLKADGFRALRQEDHPSVSVVIGNDQKALQMENDLWQLGVYQPAVRWPAVPANQSRFRLNVSFDHTSHHNRALRSAFESGSQSTQI